MRQDAFISTSNWSGDYFIRFDEVLFFRVAILVAHVKHCAAAFALLPIIGPYYLPSSSNLATRARVLLSSRDLRRSTAGVSLVMAGQGVVQQLQRAFDRDWNSEFAVALP